MKLYNTLTNQKEEFKPLHDNTVQLYSCGPTVYGIAHIGNLRTYLFNDFLKRVLVLAGFQVKHVMNITDVDDKTIKASSGHKEEFKKLTKQYEEIFFNNLQELDITFPTVVTRATEYIDKMVEFIQELMDKGFAYRGEDGSIYFSINKFEGYGKLSKLDQAGVQIGARVSQDEYTKENPADFALWKAWDEKDGEIYWETPLGKGRPGWHIECSAMSQDVLGETIDIHTGGVDLIFPHHENEIAQSEARSGKNFANFWLHGEHILVDNQKMAKSLGNVYHLSELKERDFEPLDYRYLILGVHYRTKLNFTWEGLQAARNGRKRLLRLVSEMASDKDGEISSDYFDKFKERLFDDLDTPGALAAVWEMMRDEKKSNQEKMGTLIEMDKVLGLNLLSQEIETVPEEVKELAEKRQEARANKDFGLSDQLREKISSLGWRVEDRGGGYRLSKE